MLCHRAGSCRRSVMPVGCHDWGFQHRIGGKRFTTSARAKGSPVPLPYLPLRRRTRWAHSWPITLGRTFSREFPERLSLVRECNNSVFSFLHLPIYSRIANVRCSADIDRVGGFWSVIAALTRKGTEKSNIAKSCVGLSADKKKVWKIKVLILWTHTWW